MTSVASGGDRCGRGWLGGSCWGPSSVRCFFRTLRCWMEAADRPETSLLEDDSWPDVKVCDGDVAACAMWPVRKAHVAMMSPSRGVRGRAAEPLLISWASIFPKAVLFCSKSLRHWR